MKKSPFKFLGAYTQKDKNCFWGREEAINLLLEQLNQTSLLLCYGAAGVGKTSLIEAGFLPKLAESENTSLIIRRENNLVSSFFQSINNLLSNTYELDKENTLSFEGIVKELITEQQKTIYFVFDQFEELIIYGNEQEQADFFQKLNVLLEAKMDCKVILVVQEAFLGKLSEAEKDLPILFQNRFRVGGINGENLIEIVQKTLTFAPFQADFKVEKAREIAEKIEARLAEESNENKLAFAQIYLEHLYQKASETALADELPLLTPSLISKKDNISNIFVQFLTQKIKDLTLKYPEFPKDLPLEILATLISSENQSLQRKDRDILKKIADNPLFLQISILEVRLILNYFAENRLLRKNIGGEQSLKYELVHHFVGAFVRKKIQERDISVAQAQAIYVPFLQKMDTERLSLEEIILLESQDNISPLPTSLKTKIKKTRKEFAERDAKRQFKVEQKLKRAPRLFAITSVLAVLMLFFFGWAFYLYKTAKTDLQNIAFEELKNKRMFSSLYFYEGRFGLANKGEKYGFIDKGANTRIEYDYDFALPFEAEIGLAKVKIRQNPTEKESPLVDFMIDTLGKKYRLATQVKDLTPEILALDLRHQQLNTIPEEVFSNTQLKVLLLNYNQLQNLPENLSKLSSLKILNVSHNQLSKIENLAQLKLLEKLDISYNKISKIENLEDLEALGALNISNNQISVMENLANLKELSMLDISANKITKKEGIENLKKLKEVIMYGNVISAK